MQNSTKLVRRQKGCESVNKEHIDPEFHKLLPSYSVRHIEELSQASTSSSRSGAPPLPPDGTNRDARSRRNASTPLKICSPFPFLSLSTFQPEETWLGFFLFPFFCVFWSVQWQVSLNKAEIYGQKGEHTDSDFPLAASHDSTYMRSFECSCQLYKSTSRPLHSSPCSVLFSPRSHRYPEQHDKNNNALFTGQYIVTVQSSLAVDLRSLGFLSAVNL